MRLGSSGHPGQAFSILSFLFSSVWFFSFFRQSQAGRTQTKVEVEASVPLLVELSPLSSSQFRCSVKATLVGVTLLHTLTFCFYYLRWPLRRHRLSSLSSTFSKWTEEECLPEWVLRAASTWRHSNRRRLSQLTSALLDLAIASARSSSCLCWSHNRACVGA